MSDPMKPRRTYVNPQTFRHPAVIPVLRNGVIILKLVNYDPEWGRQQGPSKPLLTRKMIEEARSS